MSAAARPETPPSGRATSDDSACPARTITRRLAVFVLALAATACAPAGPPGITIVNVRVIDGTGAPATPGAVRLIGDTVVAVGADVTPARGDSIVDGGGLVLAPGFIDTHSHHASGLGESPDARAAASQGITTVVGGQDGSHPMPLAKTLAALERSGTVLNAAFYAGHGTIRDSVLGRDFRRRATAAEVEAMGRLLRQELDAGALGLSTGLEYDPGIYSDRAEVLALAKVAAAAGTRYISHIRSEDRWFWDAVDEVLAIGREAKLPVQIGHVKLAMIPLWGQADSLLRVLDRARAEGIDVTADVYPYPYWQSTLTVLFPKRDFGNQGEAEHVLRDIARPEGLLLGDYLPEPSYAGRTVAEVAAMRKEPPAVTLMTLIRDAQRMRAERERTGKTEGRVESVVATSMDEGDIARLLAWPHANVCSDGALDGAHPRGYGAFPRVLARYVRERRVLPLEEAIRKMTSLAAAHVGIPQRGTIAPGRFADLVLFDPATVADEATTQDPHRISTGIARVWVNGREVWRDGAPTGARPGRVIRRPGTPADGG
ncbi:MAG: N-acyl-D-amino-acid deacylase family protein [Gemmatimonadota bacterium]